MLKEATLDEEYIQKSFLNLFLSEKIDVRLAKNFVNEWNEVLDKNEYIPVSYTRAMLDYQECYMRCFVKQMIDLSIVFYDNNHPIGIWPLSFKIEDKRCEFASNEGPVLQPLFIMDLSERIKKKLYEACLNTLNKMYSFLSESTAASSLKTEWQGNHFFLLNNINDWYRKCMERGARVTVSHQVYVDLSYSYEDIKRNIRKSFKSLVNMGERLWNVKIYDEISDDVFSQYRELHYKVAGRVTRSLETWELQKNAINNKDAFLVALYNDNDELVGGGLFHVSRDEGVYAVGVYNRELFDKPLGHLVQMEAIKYMKELGLKWYKIGDRHYWGDAVKPTEKEYSIGYFKEGFATHIFLKGITECSLLKGESL